MEAKSFEKRWRLKDKTVSSSPILCGRLGERGPYTEGPVTKLVGCRFLERIENPTVSARVEPRIEEQRAHQTWRLRQHMRQRLMLQSVEVGLPRHSARWRQVCKRGRAETNKLEKDQGKGVGSRKHR